MRDVKRLLDGAALPWGDGTGDFFIPATSRNGYWTNDVHSDRPVADADLIVYAVNRLPDYEAAVETLVQILEHGYMNYELGDPDCAAVYENVVAILRRLRDEVPA